MHDFVGNSWTRNYLDEGKKLIFDSKDPDTGFVAVPVEPWEDRKKLAAQVFSPPGESALVDISSRILDLPDLHITNHPLSTSFFTKLG